MSNSNGNHIISSDGANKIYLHLNWLISQSTNLLELYDLHFNSLNACQLLAYLIQVVEDNSYYYPGISESAEFKKAKQRLASSCSLD